MNGTTGWIAVSALLWAIAACCMIADARKWLRIRREERAARERQDEQDRRVAAHIKAAPPEPLESAEDAVAWFGSLHEQPKSASDGRRR